MHTTSKAAKKTVLVSVEAVHIFTIVHENCDITSGSLLVVLGNKEESKQHVLKGSNTKMTYKCGQQGNIMCYSRSLQIPHLVISSKTVLKHFTILIPKSSKTH